MGHWSDNTRHELTMMGEKGYVRVLDGRPLYYLLATSQRQIETEWGSAAGVAGLVGFMRAQAKSDGLGDPYIVLLGRDAALAQAIGCDAAGAYAIVGHPDQSSYAEARHLCRAALGRNGRRRNGDGPDRYDRLGRAAADRQSAVLGPII